MNRMAERMVDKNLSQRERVSIALQSFGEREIHFVIDDIAGMTDLKGSSVYQILWRMQQANEIEILTESINGSDRKRVSGAILNKLEPATDILERVPARVEKNGTKLSAQKTQNKVKDVVPNIVRYMEQKLVVEKVKAQLLSAGLPDNVPFEENPYAEEGINLLNDFINISREKTELMAQVGVMSREMRLLKGQKHPVPEVGGEPISDESSTTEAAPVEAS